MSLLGSFARALGFSPSPQVYIRQHRRHGREIKTVGLKRARNRAEKRGRADADSGQHSIYSNAAEPAEASGLSSAEDANEARVRASLDEVLIGARARSAAADAAFERSDVARDAADEALASARAHRSSLSEERFGFAAINPWAAWALAVLIFLGDLLLTLKAFSDLDAPEYEKVGLAATVGALLFLVGIAKAYIDVVDFRAGDSERDRPWPTTYKKSLSRLLIWATALMVFALFFARVGILDLESWGDSGVLGLIVANTGAFLAVGFAAALVAIAAYLGAFVSFVSRPISKAKAQEKAARRALKAATKTRAKAELRQTAAASGLARAEGIVEEAPAVVRSTWGEVRAAYWRGFALGRPEEQTPLKPLPGTPEEK